MNNNADEETNMDDLEGPTELTAEPVHWQVAQPSHRIVFAGFGKNEAGSMTVEWEDEPGSVIVQLASIAAAALFHDCSSKGDGAKS